MPKRKQIVPGSVFVRKGTNKLTIKYRGKQYPTGLEDSVQGRKIAEEKLRRMHFDYINVGPPPAQNNKFIQEAFNDFLAEHCKDLSDNTKYLYKNAFTMITPKDYHISIERIEHDIEIFIETRSKTLNPRSISNYLKYYKIIVRYFIKKTWLKKQPEKLISEHKISRKKEVKKTVMTYEKSEFDMLIEYFVNKDKDMALLLLFLWHTGGRIRETVNLTWSQIDFKLRRISFPNKIKKNEDDYIPISSAAETILKLFLQYKVEIRKQDQAHLTKKEITFAQNDKVFRWTHKVTENFLRKKINSAMESLHIDRKGRSFHSIRKTFATNLFEKNVSLVDVMDLMRHKNVKTTLDYYKEKKTHRLESIVELNIVESETAPKLHL